MNPRGSGWRLGIDLGSVSLKAALVSGADVIYERWMRVDGEPVAALRGLFESLCELYPDAAVSGVAVTGSGRGLIADVIAAREVNEISAHAGATAVLYPQVRTIIEIGGQDSKLIIVGDGDHVIEHFAMNEVCAAGTGAFLDQQAARLNLSIDEFAALALDSTSPARIAGRCAVFAKTDMTHHQQEGRPLADIVAGLNEALARSYLSNLVRGRKLPAPIAFQGGVARNTGLVAAFRRLLRPDGDHIFVPRYHGVMGAIGAAFAIEDGRPRRLADVRADLKSGTVAKRARAANGRRPCLNGPRSRPLDVNVSSLGLDGVYLGIDVGSVSVKLAALSPAGVVYSDYRSSEGRPLDVLRSMHARMRERLGTVAIAGAGVTGSGRHLVGAVIAADVVENEITAQARAAALALPGVDTVIEIGGQDAKFIRLEEGRPTHFSMNRVCAAGTGAFLQEQAARLAVSVEGEFASEALASQAPAALGARCTVFMESDLVAHQQQGATRRDLIAGLAYSVAENYVDKVIGARALGDRVLFLGGVAENGAVAAALESTLSRRIETSAYGKVSGAIGAALAAFAARREGKYVESRSPGPRLAHRSSSEESGRLGRRDAGAWSPLERRLRLLEEASTACRPQPTEGGIRVGIPRAMMAYDRLPLWRCFFEAMGVETVVSPPTTGEILGSGVERQVVETCLPVKAFCAHARWLEEHGRCDFVFAPSLVATGVDIHGKETVHCPFVQSAAQFARPATDLPLLNPVVNWRWRPDDEEREMIAVTGRIGVDPAAARLAWAEASRVQSRFRENVRALGRQALSDLASGKLKRAFVLLGKDYNICDPRLNSGVGEILAARRECVLTQDMLADDGGAYSPAYRTMYWSHSKEILAAAEIVARTPGLWAVMITSFGCGPDSFTLRMVADIMGEKPALFLDVDEHSSSVGTETRMEAFLDSLPGAPERRTSPPRAALARPKGIRRVYVPNFSDHALAFAAAVDAMGLEPVLTKPPDDRAAIAGTKRCTAGECHPFALLLGGYIQAAEAERGRTDACYLIPESNLCRLGQFGTQMRLVAEEMGLSLPVYTRFEDLAAVGRAGLVRAGIRYWQALRGMDFLLQKFFETRAREITPGATDRAYADARGALFAKVVGGEICDGLRNALLALESVPVDRSRKLVRIGITGDYYTRICDYANADMFRHIERMGGLVLLPSTLSELVIYDAQRNLSAARERGEPGSAALFWMTQALLTRTEKSVRQVFGDSLSYDVPLDSRRGVQLAAPYMDRKAPSGLLGSVAGILEQIHAGAGGILSLITLHCSYGLALNAALASIDRDYPGIPKLSLIFEGLKPTHNLTRLEAFMEIAKRPYRPTSR